MKRRGSMRAALIAAFVIVTTVPMLVAAAAGVWFFHQSISAEAKRVSAEHMRMASDMLDARMQMQLAALRAAAASAGTAEKLTGGSAEEREKLLSDAATSGKFTYTLLVDSRGRIVAASRGKAGGSMSKGAVAAALNGRTGSGVGEIDKAELERRDLVSATRLEVKSAPNATVRHSSLDGALAVSSAVPVVNGSGRTVAALVGVEVLNRSTNFIDEATKRLGGTVTVFHHEVRIATSVRLDNGERAVGTVASDKVQRQVLTDGQPFEGVASVVGKPFQASYVALRDWDGKIVGMLYVGFPTAPYDASTRLFALRFLGTATLGLLLSVGAGFALSAVLSRPVASIASAAGAVADGDLTAAAPINGTRETAALGEAFNAMVTQLSGVLSHASETAGKLRSIAGDLRAQSGLQAEGSNRQASAIAETTATLEELAATYGAVASGAEEVMRRAEDAVEAAQQGRSTLDESVGELERLFNGAEQVASAAGGVSEASSEIAGAIGIIESIAEQTKILALNAAIEAARAGEAGRGFAVVAQEIRQLADSVSESTRRIEQMVGEIQGATRGLADLSREQNGLAEHSVALGRRTAASFSDILEQMMSTAAAARQIASAAVQQRTATGQVVEAMHQVSNAASDTARAADRVDTASQEVLQSGAALDDSLKGFRL